jgi:hypothetical protein
LVNQVPAGLAALTALTYVDFNTNCLEVLDPVGLATSFYNFGRGG